MKRIAVFGYSSLSFEAMNRLTADQYALLFLAKDPAEAALVNDKGFKTEVIDFRNDDDLRAIGIGTDIDIIFCFYPNDSDNVFLTISARALDKDVSIIAIVDDPESAPKLLAAGANKIIDPYEICGRKTHEMLTRPDIANILDNTVFGRHDLKMAQIEIPKGSWLANIKTSDLNIKDKHNLLLIAVVDKTQEDQLHFVIGDSHPPLKPGDVLVVMGPSREIKLFKEEVEHVGNHKI
jgi:voltage-gated potassium channel